VWDVTARCIYSLAGGLSACNVGIDGTPPGCDLLQVKAASYHAPKNRIYIRLSNGSLLWATSPVVYESWKDKHIGEFEKGSDALQTFAAHKVRARRSSG